MSWCWVTLASGGRRGSGTASSSFTPFFFFFFSFFGFQEMYECVCVSVCGGMISDCVFVLFRETPVLDEDADLANSPPSRSLSEMEYIEK